MRAMRGVIDSESIFHYPVRPMSSSQKKMRIKPPQPSARVKRRRSPGGSIRCPHDHIVPRGRYNMALRLQMIPTCNFCGSTDLTVNGPHEIRVAGLSKRLIFKKHRGQLRKL